MRGSSCRGAINCRITTTGFTHRRCSSGGRDLIGIWGILPIPMRCRIRNALPVREFSARSDSLFEIAIELRTQLGSSGASRNNGRDASRDAGGSSATAAYNIMRKWNLKFSGIRGEDAEMFLLRIEEGCELIPVADEDILRCLPLFLDGIACISRKAGAVTELVCV